LPSVDPNSSTTAFPATKPHENDPPTSQKAKYKFPANTVVPLPKKNAKIIDRSKTSSLKDFYALNIAQGPPRLFSEKMALLKEGLASGTIRISQEEMQEIRERSAERLRRLMEEKKEKEAREEAEKWIEGGNEKGAEQEKEIGRKRKKGREEEEAGGER
jgi:hypothetical protein